jgi:hypothetical protein
MNRAISNPMDRILSVWVFGSVDENTRWCSCQRHRAALLRIPVLLDQKVPAIAVPSGLTQMLFAALDSPTSDDAIGVRG